MSFKEHLQSLTEARVPNATPDIRIPGVQTKGTFFPAGTVGPEGIPYYGTDATNEKEAFRSIVIHHTAGGSFAGARDEAFRLRNGSWYAGYHFIVDTDGTVYQMAPESVRTNHSTDKGRKGGLFNNRRSIGVSFVGGASGPFTPSGRQREMGLTLIAGLMKRYRIQPNAIAGHHNTDSKSNMEGDWIYAAINSGELDQYLGNSKATPLDFSGIVNGVSDALTKNRTNQFTALAIGGILLGGIYAFKRYLRNRAVQKEAEKMLEDRIIRVAILRIRAENKDLIEKAKSDPQAKAKLERMLNDAITDKRNSSYL